MTTPTDPLAAVLARLTAIEQAATAPPWTAEESDKTWRLYGTHAIVPAQAGGLIPPQRLTLQILKAPKQGTPYAEYWPGPGDTAFITEARGAFPALLAVARRLAEAHQPVPVYEIAMYTHGPGPLAGMLLCGHPEADLDGPRHAPDENEDGWLCLDKVAYTACTGCPEGESGDDSDFASCGVRRVLAEELGRLGAVS